MRRQRRPEGCVRSVYMTSGAETIGGSPRAEKIQGSLREEESSVILSWENEASGVAEGVMRQVGNH